jgi:hypothetical protein
MRAGIDLTVASSRERSIWQVVVPWRGFAAIAGSLPLMVVLVARLGS